MNANKISPVERVSALIDWGEKTALRLTLEQESWQKLKFRILLVVCVYAAVLIYHTAVVTTPRFLVGAIYHGRTLGIQDIRNMNPDYRAKLINRLHEVSVYYNEGKEP